MERVAFLLEGTGERLACMLNPESLIVRRLAGVRQRRSLGGALTGPGLTDDMLLYSGGGTTELHLDLLFDVSLASSSVKTDDVRVLTGPLWQLAENDSRAEKAASPSLVRFVWGKSWNIPGVVAAVAERLEQFTPEGAPMRSWLRMRFLRVSELATQTSKEPFSPPSTDLLPEIAPEPASEPAPPVVTADTEVRVHQVSAGERLDQIAHRYYGSAVLWRWLALVNGLTDPLQITPGSLLQIPPISFLERRR
jgi:hypothetical protein